MSGLGAFDASDLGAFIESALGARGQESSYAYSATVTVTVYDASGVWPGPCDWDWIVQNGPGLGFRWGLIIGNLGSVLPWWDGFAPGDCLPSGTEYTYLTNCYAGNCFTYRQSGAFSTGGRHGCTTGPPGDTVWTMYYNAL